ncbi:MAG: hypothetical protein LBT45_02830 [Rickettsiales bacterium]|jgi:hypothetical protein|nr:hypothetical protein [Rickettsiales bacterium]
MSQNQVLAKKTNSQDGKKSSFLDLKKIKDLLLAQYMNFLVRSANREIEIGQNIPPNQYIVVDDNRLFEYLGEDAPFGARYVPTFVNYLLSGYYKRDEFEKGDFIGRDRLLEMAAETRGGKAEMLRLAKDGKVFSSRGEKEYNADYDRLISLMMSNKYDMDGRRLIEEVFDGNSAFDMLELIKLYKMIELSSKLLKKSKVSKNKDSFADRLEILAAGNEFISSINAVFAAYKHNDKTFARLLVIGADAAEIFDQFEKQFLALVKTDAAVYKEAKRNKELVAELFPEIESDFEMGEDEFIIHGADGEDYCLSLEERDLARRVGLDTMAFVMAEETRKDTLRAYLSAKREIAQITGPFNKKILALVSYAALLADRISEQSPKNTLFGHAMALRGGRRR